MRFGVISLGLLSSLALVAFADSAAAQSQNSGRSRAPVVSLSEANAARAAAVPPQQGQRRGLRLSENGRWGLDLNVTEPTGREANLGDVEAGAYYRVNPNLRLGASAGLDTPEPSPSSAPQTDRRTASRFRLESIFRF